MVLSQTFAPNSLRQDLNRQFYSAPIAQPGFAQNFYGQPAAFIGQPAGFYANSLYQTPFYGAELRGQIVPNVAQHGYFVPKANWAETPEGAFITVELPGVELSQISLRIEGTYLVLEGIRHPGGLLGDRMVSYNVAEGRFGAFRWVCPIPNGIQVAALEASFRNGLLQIMLPRHMVNTLNPIVGQPVHAAAPTAQIVIKPGVNA